MSNINRKIKLERKLAILEKGRDICSSSKAKDREDRKKFWSEMMETAPRHGDRLKASELLGRSEADFTDKIGLGAVDGDGEITEIPILLVRPTPLIDLEENG